jgi:hypothetical protein
MNPTRFHGTDGVADKEQRLLLLNGSKASGFGAIECLSPSEAAVTSPMISCTIHIIHSCSCAEQKIEIQGAWLRIERGPNTGRIGIGTATTQEHNGDASRAWVVRLYTDSKGHRAPLHWAFDNTQFADDIYFDVTAHLPGGNIRLGERTFVKGDTSDTSRCIFGRLPRINKLFSHSEGGNEGCYTSHEQLFVWRGLYMSSRSSQQVAESRYPEEFRLILRFLERVWTRLEAQADLIKGRVRRALSDPQKELCKRRLNREFLEMGDALF